jgi:hypothetical protein
VATTIVANLPIPSDGTGHGNQSHLFYNANQKRWWCFLFLSKTATVLSCYVSSQADIRPGNGATWSAGTDSPVFPTSRALSANDQRNLACVAFANGSTDVVHASVGIAQSGAAQAGFTEHIRATFTGAAGITWESWTELSSATGTWEAVKGNALGRSDGSGFIHEMALTFNNSADPNLRLSTAGDKVAAWSSTAFGALTQLEAVSNQTNQGAFAPLAGDAMLVVYENGGAASPNLTNLRWVKYPTGSGATWPTGGANVFAANSTQDSNDWCLCSVNLNAAYCIRRTGTTTFEMSFFNGTSWQVVSAPPVFSGVTHKAGSGLFAATDGTDLWLVAMTTTGNQPVWWVRYTPLFDSWGTWQNLEAGGSTARNFLSGYPVVANGQIGLIWTDVFGANFNVVTSAISVGPAPVLVAHTDAFGANNVTTVAIDTTGANFIVCLAAVDATATGPVWSDNKGNGAGVSLTWNKGTLNRSSSRLTYYLDPIVGPGHTFNLNDASGLNGSLLVAAFSGVKLAGAFDQQAAAAHAGSGATTIAAGPITPTDDGELIIVGWGVDDPVNTTWAVDSSFTIIDIQDVVPGSIYGGVLAYRLVGAGGGPINPTFTRSNAIAASREDTAVIASFRAAVAAVIEQYSFRPRNDDGSETTATWKGAESVNFTAVALANLRLRAGVNITSLDPPATEYQLEYREAGGAWKIVEK